MGKQIHLKNIERLFKKSSIIDFKSLERVIGVKKNSNYAKLLVSNMLKQGKIKKIGKGIYTKFSESSLAVFAFKPAYLGLQSSLSFHGVWEQEVIPVILTTKKVRVGIRKVLDSNILVRNIDKKHFFGYSLLKDGNFYLPYSDLEKTLIDMITFNQTLDDDTLKEIKKKIDKKKISLYLKRYNSRTRKIVQDKLKHLPPKKLKFPKAH